MTKDDDENDDDCDGKDGPKMARLVLYKRLRRSDLCYIHIPRLFLHPNAPLPSPLPRRCPAWARTSGTRTRTRTREGGRGGWKLNSAKGRVTTHPPNGLAPKMDGAHARVTDTQPLLQLNCVASVSRRARGIRTKHLAPAWVEPASIADLGGISKYSNI